MADSPNGKVIVGTFGEQTEASIKGYGRRCRHGKYTLDEETRTVECGACGETLSAYDILKQYAERQRHWKWRTSELNEAETRITELKAEEKRVKARLRNAKKKDIDIALAAQRKHLTEKLQRMHWKLAEASRAINAAKNALPSPQESMFEEEDRG